MESKSTLIGEERCPRRPQALILKEEEKIPIEWLPSLARDDVTIFEEFELDLPSIYLDAEGGQWLDHSPPITATLNKVAREGKMKILQSLISRLEERTRWLIGDAIFNAAEYDQFSALELLLDQPHSTQNSGIGLALRYAIRRQHTKMSTFLMARIQAIDAHRGRNSLLWNGAVLDFALRGEMDIVSMLLPHVDPKHFLEHELTCVLYRGTTSTFRFLFQYAITDLRMENDRNWTLEKLFPHLRLSFRNSDLHRWCLKLTKEHFNRATYKIAKHGES